MRIILWGGDGRRVQTPPCAVRAARDITYTPTHAHAYIPLGPPNNYSLYIRFMHLGALTDYFNEGNLDERDKERSKFGECHVLHALETSIGTYERTNGCVATFDYYA